MTACKCAEILGKRKLFLNRATSI